MQKFNMLKPNNNMTNFYYYSKQFTNEEIDKLLEIVQKYNQIDGNVSGSVDYNYRKSKITWLPLNDESDASCCLRRRIPGQ